jgi:hypothetical protein
MSLLAPVIVTHPPFAMQQGEAVVPLVATVVSLLERSAAAVWVLSFARRNVSVQLVIDEAAAHGLVIERPRDFSLSLFFKKNLIFSLSLSLSWVSWSLRALPPNYHFE